MSMIQLGLHSKCCNHCDFCTIIDNGLTEINDIIKEIEKAKENIVYISKQKDNWLNKYSDGISILGGEIYFIKDKRYKDAILSLIDVILEYILIPNKNNKKCKFSTVTNGMYDPEWLLFPVVDKIKDTVGIDHVDVNFSYDFKYRFHSEDTKHLVEKNINLFHDRYNYCLGIQMILTQDVINMYLKGWRTTDFINSTLPGNMISFLYPHPIHRGNNESGAKNLPNFNFSRSSFLKFLRLVKEEEPRVFESFYYSTNNSAIFKYTMLHNKMDKGTSTQDPILSDGKEIVNISCPNNHSILYKCYADSDKCLLCDLNANF